MSSQAAIGATAGRARLFDSVLDTVAPALYPKAGTDRGRGDQQQCRASASPWSAHKGHPLIVTMPYTKRLIRDRLRNGRQADACGPRSHFKQALSRAKTDHERRSKSATQAPDT